MSEVKSLTVEEKAKILADYKADKAAKKAAKKAEIEKEAEIEKNLTADQKRRIDERTKEIKAESTRKADLAKEEEKQLKEAEKAKIASMSKEDAEKYLADKKAKTTAERTAKYETLQAEKNAKLAKMTEDLALRQDVGGKIHKFFHAVNMTAFCRFFSNGWLKFSTLHPSGANILRMVFFFIVFSEGVTIWQFIVMTFLPLLLTGLGTTPWGWPAVTLSFAAENNAQYIILGDTNGLGYFLAFEIAVFTAQCINFPLQRNITYRSHGNVAVQIMWYFIGWLLISFATNAIWGFLNCLFTSWGWYLVGAEGLATLAGLFKTILTGGISMVIFFFIFLIIFPAGAADTSREEAKKEILAADAVLRA